MFDWSNLERNSIIDMLMELSPKLVNTTMSPTVFHNIMARYVKKLWPVVVVQEWDPKVKSHTAFIGGVYYSDRDEDFKKCIELTFVYNPQVKKVKVGIRKFRTMCSVIADTLLHEIMHMRQYRRRDFKQLPEYASSASSSKVREEQIYLGCSDEIDDYGFNIACELLEKFKGDWNKSINFLGEDLKNTRVRGGCWKMYLKAFKHDHNHEIIRKLKKKVIRYLPRAEEGKPFKSRDWICH